MNQLSARVTPVLKYLGPTAWVVGWGYATVLLFEDPGAMFRPDDDIATALAKWIFLVIAVLGGVLVARYVLPLKHVVLDGDRLRVSNYLRETTIPLTDVSAFWPHPRYADATPFALIELRTPSDFGQNIRFLLSSEEAYNAMRSALASRELPADKGPS